MTDRSNDRPVNTQRARRIKYGLNVTVAVLAAAALVVLVNWIAYRQYVRFDLTATRRYSLSEQTEKVLGQLEGEYRVVTLFRETSPYLEQVRDLIDEYGRYSDHLAVEHLNPDLDIAKREAFYNQLRQRYAQELTPTVEAIEAGRATLEQVRAAVAEMMPQLRAAAEHPELGETDLQRFIQSVATAFHRFESELETLDEQVGDVMDQPLPNYDAALTDLRAILQQLNDNAFTIALERFRQASDQAATPNAVKNQLLGLVKRLEAVRSRVDETVDTLSAVQPVERYEQVRSSLLGAPSVVVLGPEQVQVVPASEMFREPDPEQVQAAGQPELRFLGEERLTGTLVSMSLAQPPMVVFVFTGQQPAIGPRGQYELVAERLRRANFRVEQWNPSGQFTAMGQPTPPGPPPQPAEGQKVVWVITPMPPDNPMNPMSMGGGKQAVADLLKDRLDAGDAAMVMLMANPMTGFGPGDPIAQYVETWDITPQLDRIILRQVQLPDRQTRATTQLEVEQWPEALAVTEALRGMRTLLLQASPLVVGQGAATEVRHYPLIQVRGDKLWAETDLASAEAVQNAEFDPGQHQDRYTVGAAAEHENKRLVVVADPAWATNTVTSYGAMGPGTAELFGALFPGNSELFVNSVYWLAGLDELIAASPRSQDIRRIEALSPTTVRVYHWSLLVGMPVVIAAVGFGVWFVRRRG